MRREVPETIPRLSKLKRLPDSWVFQWSDDLVYHYTSAEAAFQIISENRILFGRMTNTNDPYEKDIWGIAVIQRYGERYNAFVEDHTVTEVRRNCRVLCLSRDGYDASFDQIVWGVGRGWALPCLWAHYAQRHHGVCIAFDKNRLLKAALDMATLDSGIVIARNVKYDGPPQLDDDFFWAMLPRDSTSGDNVVTQGIRDHMLKNARDLFFRKDPSWAPEREFRIIVLKSSDGDFGVKVESALVGLVTGSEFGRMDSRLFTECRHRLKSLELARLTWDCGRPMIESW